MEGTRFYGQVTTECSTWLTDQVELASTFSGAAIRCYRKRSKKLSQF